MREDKVEKAEASGVLRLESDIDAQLLHLDGLKKQVAEHQDALKYKYTKVKKLERTLYMADHHHIAKVSCNMTTMNLLTIIAKLVTSKIHHLGMLQGKVPVMDESVMALLKNDLQVLSFN